MVFCNTLKVQNIKTIKSCLVTNTPEIHIYGYIRFLVLISVFSYDLGTIGASASVGLGICLEVIEHAHYTQSFEYFVGFHGILSLCWDTFSIDFTQ